ncbi:hypothetical protein CH373_12120 [Leptospira perolatii]|uniref:Thioredoxin domain-containing protein n=1 Tax=Leptospira perolatii TaxID=2023191 RepID=A0A2M9ZLR1_9LEPT|nr:hypothetical protein CH360_06850 [Leptospira perolatii]PJZ72931.1 hypothetical protein CH373_12120 [Leptospira perolatii]
MATASLLLFGFAIGWFGVNYFKKSSDSSEVFVPEWSSVKLTDQEGKDLVPSSLNGELFVVYFGFSHCPDMCPLALSDITIAYQNLNPQEQSKVRPVFISVDPERDTPEVMKKYVERFPGKALVAMTGKKQLLETMQIGFGARSKKVSAPSLEGGYSVDHTVLIYLVSKQGKILAAYPSGTSPEELRKGIISLL